MKKIMLAILVLCSLVQAQTSKTLNATVSAAHSVQLSWNASLQTSGTSAVTGANIYRGTVSGQEVMTPINTSLLPNSVTSFTDTNVQPNTTYYYIVEYYCPTCVKNLAGIIGNSNPSNEVFAVIPGDPTPQAPVLTLGTVAKNHVPLFWSTPNTKGITVNSYNIYRCKFSTCPNPPKIGEATGTSFIDTAPYTPISYYQVSANDTVNNKSVVSPKSNIVTAKVN